MSDRYRHIFFDLDHTLWDFESNSENTLSVLAQKYALPDAHGPQGFIATYKKTNKALWALYEQGKIDQQTLRHDRFRISLESQGISHPELAKTLSEEYLDELPNRNLLMEGAREVLEYLSDKYSLHLITNGFEKVQVKKINNAGIQDFFEAVITSEKAGFMKPDQRIFEYALLTTQAHTTNSLMIGDNHQADVMGAAGMGMDQVWFNPTGESATHVPTYHITSLKELKNFL
jgi:putative hydrolase of the HAD superfamily